MKLTVKCISYEKRAKFSDENIAYYHEWVDIYKKTDEKRLIFCDASGFNRYNFHAKKAVFSTGQTVNISSKKGRLTGTIVKLNRTKAVVEIDGRQYNCPISIMEVA